MAMSTKWHDECVKVLALGTPGLIRERGKRWVSCQERFGNWWAVMGRRVNGTNKGVQGLLVVGLKMGFLGKNTLQRLRVMSRDEDRRKDNSQAKTRPETRDWDYKLMFTMFTEVINEVRSFLTQSTHSLILLHNRAYVCHQISCPLLVSRENPSFRHVLDSPASARYSYCMNAAWNQGKVSVCSAATRHKTPAWNWSSHICAMSLSPPQVVPCSGRGALIQDDLSFTNKDTFHFHVVNKQGL